MPQGSHLGPTLFLVFINDVHQILSQFDVEYLLFCDDIKLFKAITSQSDQILLQNALSALCNWINSICLSVNASKSQVISFSRGSFLEFSYSIDSSVIPRSSCVRDLGVLYDSNLSFVPQINKICSKASGMLGFLFRSTKDFSNVLPLKILYCSLVRGILEFASPVWNPYYDVHSTALERIQHRALKYMARKFNLGHTSYKDVERALNLLPLSNRRTLYDTITFFKILNSQIDTPDLLGKINISAPGRYSRHTLPFYTPHARYNYLINSPLNRFQRLANELSEDLDLFCCSVPEIKSHFLHEYFHSN